MKNEIFWTFIVLNKKSSHLIEYIKDNFLVYDLVSCEKYWKDEKYTRIVISNSFNFFSKELYVDVLSLGRCFSNNWLINIPDFNSDKPFVFSGVSSENIIFSGLIWINFEFQVYPSEQMHPPKEPQQNCLNN